eukprot:2221711-Alexandrium_andersonii.AAC.1
MARTKPIMSAQAANAGALAGDLGARNGCPRPSAMQWLMRQRRVIWISTLHNGNPRGWNDR